MEKTVKIGEIEWKYLQQQKLNENLEKISEVIKENIMFSKKFNNEKEFCSWIRKNYNMLGFDGIIKENRGGVSPDFIFKKGGHLIRTEIETLSSHFVQHKHNPENFDLVICLINDKVLPVRTVEINPFEYIKPKPRNGANETTIGVSKKTVKQLETFRSYPRQSYDDIINLLIFHCKEAIKRGDFEVIKIKGDLK